MHTPSFSTNYGCSLYLYFDLNDSLAITLLLEGATTLVHSGRKSVVGNSKVEEHISRQALTDVFQLQQHSQDPANLTEHKMEEHISRQALTDVFQLQQHSQDPANLTEHKMEVHITLRWLYITHSQALLTQGEPGSKG